MLARTIVVHQRGLLSCEITPTAFMVWPPPCTEGNKAHDGSTESLIVKTAGSRLGAAWRKAHQRPTYAWGRPGAIHGVTRLSAWPLRGIPCKGLQRGLGGRLRASRYLGKNTRVIDGSLHISTLLFSFRIYIVCITPFCDRDSNTLAKP